MNRLAQVAAERLRTYIRRLTGDEDLTQDMVQESMLEMFKFLDKLERVDRFWPWLFRIATRNVQDHHERERRRRTSAANRKLRPHTPGSEVEGLQDIVGRELKQVVAAAMLRLRPEYRTVLTLRCYEEMPYSEISHVMACSEFSARMRFFRAKKALVRQLSKQGFGKKSLVLALALYGKMTATSEAAAAQVSVTAATVKVGAAASVAAMAAGRTAVVLLAGALVAGGSLALQSGRDGLSVGPGVADARSFFDDPSRKHARQGGRECWYYYPPNANGTVMMWIKSGADGRDSYCQWFQNDQANYYRRGESIQINNYRMWNEDLSVMRLPTDRPQLTEFLAVVEGRRKEMEYVPAENNGLLIAVGMDMDGRRAQVVHRRDISDEEYFRYNRPSDAKIVDNRDLMHRRGWTYFRIDGHMKGRNVTGCGRLPFVHAAAGTHYPWLRLKVAGRLEIIDAGREARLSDGDGKLESVYEGGTFFNGLARPWMGLHTIDTVRRDAAQQRIWFETELLPEGRKARVTLTLRQARIVYTISLEDDVIESVEFLAGDRRLGQLHFSYVQQVEEASQEFLAPSLQRLGTTGRLGGFWPMRMAEDTLLPVR